MAQDNKVKIDVASAPVGLRSFLKRHPFAASAAVLAAGVLMLAPVFPGGSPGSEGRSDEGKKLSGTRSERAVGRLLPLSPRPAGQRINAAQALGRAMGLGASPEASAQAPSPIKPGGSASADLAALKARGSQPFNHLSAKFFGASGGTGAATPMPDGAPASLASRLVQSVQGFVGARGAASGAKAFVAGGSASARSGSFSGAAETSYGRAHEGVGGGVLASGGPIGDATAAPAGGGVGAIAQTTTPANPVTSLDNTVPRAQNNSGAPAGGSPASALATGAGVASAVTFSPSAAQWDMTAPLTVTVSGVSSAQNTRVCQAILAHPEIPTTPHNCITQGGSINEGGFQDFAGGNADWEYTDGQWVGTFPTNYPTLGPGIEVQQVFLDASTGKFGVGTLKVTAPNSTLPAGCKVITSGPGSTETSLNNKVIMNRGQMFAFEFTMGNYSGAIPIGVEYGVAMGSNGGHSLIQHLSLSQNPCDFSRQLDAAGCGIQSESGGFFYYSPGDALPGVKNGAQPFCKVTAGKTYYFNVSNVNDNGADDCDAGFTCSYMTYNGGMYYIKSRAGDSAAAPPEAPVGATAPQSKICNALMCSGGTLQLTDYNFSPPPPACAGQSAGQACSSGQGCLVANPAACPD